MSKDCSVKITFQLNFSIQQKIRYQIKNLLIKLLEYKSKIIIPTKNNSNNNNNVMKITRKPRKLLSNINNDEKLNDSLMNISNISNSIQRIYPTQNVKPLQLEKYIQKLSLTNEGFVTTKMEQKTIKTIEKRQPLNNSIQTIKKSPNKSNIEPINSANSVNSMNNSVKTDLSIFKYTGIQQTIDNNIKKSLRKPK